MQSRYVTGALLLGLGLTVCPSEAKAQNPPPSEARTAFQEGVQHFGARRFAEALVSFQHAYRVRPHPSVMVNIANCYLALEQPLEAISWFERYLRDSTQVSPEQRTQIEHTIADARQRLVTLTILVQPPGAEVYLDGSSIGVSPLRGPRELAAGPHVIEARNPNGASVQYQARLEPGRTLTITLNTLTRESYIGSSLPGANAAALAALAPPVVMPPVVTPPVVTPPVVTPPVVTPPVVTVTPPVVTVTPPVVTPPTPLVVAPPVILPVQGETITRRRGGFVPAVVTGSVVGVGGIVAALAVTAYNQQWIAEYNQLSATYDYQRTRNAALAEQTQAQGREDLRVIEQNQTIALAFGVVGGIGAAATIGVLLFWPRETVTANSTAALRLHVMPTLNGAMLGGTF